MEAEVIRKLVNRRRGSTDYKTFVLSDLFYDGKVVKPDCLATVEDICDIPLEACEFLVYNPLEQNINKKKNYLLARPYSVLGVEDVKEFVTHSIKVLKETVVELYKKGEAWWEFVPDAKCQLKFRIVLRKANSIVPKYINEEETAYDAVGYLWNRVEGDSVYRFVDMVDASGRHRLSLQTGVDEMEKLGHATKDGKPVIFKSLPFVKMTTPSLFKRIVRLGRMYSDRYQQADALLQDNADPVAVVTNASETDPEILKEDIRETKVVRVEGDGGFAYASKTTEYSSIESFMKMTKSDMFDLCHVVSREQELNYTVSGRALDRLYVDMDSDAAEMGDVLREALKEFIVFVSQETGKDLTKDFDIVFNTDKPTDETAIIDNIVKSKGMLSEQTLLANHPWVQDPKKEMKQIEKEQRVASANAPTQELTQQTEGTSQDPAQPTEGGTNSEEEETE